MSLPKQRDLIDSVKDAINQNDLLTIQGCFADITEMNIDMDWPTVFQTVYLHSCLKGRGEIAVWLKDVVYPTMDPIQKIALRQVFSYGQYLLKKASRVS